MAIGEVEVRVLQKCSDREQYIGVIRGVVVDTSWFTGNYPPDASLDGCTVDGYPSPAELTVAPWVPVLARSALIGDSVNPFPVSTTEWMPSAIIAEA